MRPSFDASELWSENGSNNDMCARITDRQISFLKILSDAVTDSGSLGERVGYAQAFSLVVQP